MTGHLVLSTLHTNDAVSAITRLGNLGVESFLIGSALRLVCAQRLGILDPAQIPLSLEQLGLEPLEEPEPLVKPAQQEKREPQGLQGQETLEPLVKLDPLALMQ